MPTTRPRHTVTETEDVARALDDAARRWPDVRSRSQLLLQLLAEGHASLRREDAEETERRREAIRRTSGILTGAFDPGYLSDLRDDWPA